MTTALDDTAGLIAAAALASANAQAVGAPDLSAGAVAAMQASGLYAQAASNAQAAAAAAATEAQANTAGITAAATAAAGSATASAASATTAAGHASDAANSATVAAGSATSAAGYASTAGTAATAAAGSASTANTQAAAAATSATAAAGSATGAAGSASAAATSATAAASSAAGMLTGATVHTVVLSSIIALQAATIDTSVNYVRVHSYYADALELRSGALWQRSPAQSAGSGRRQSADGAWWQIAEHDLDPCMLGARSSDATTDSTTFILEAAAICNQTFTGAGATGGARRVVFSPPAFVPGYPTMPGSYNVSAEILLLAGVHFEILSGAQINVLSTFTGTAAFATLDNPVWGAQLSGLKSRGVLNCNGYCSAIWVRGGGYITLDLDGGRMLGCAQWGYRVGDPAAPSPAYCVRRIGGHFQAVLATSYAAAATINNGNSIGIWYSTCSDCHDAVEDTYVVGFRTGAQDDGTLNKVGKIHPWTGKIATGQYGGPMAVGLQVNGTGGIYDDIYVDTQSTMGNPLATAGGYTTSFTQNLTNGGGSGATVNVTCANGGITAIAVGAPGTGYTGSFSQTLTGGGGSYATVNATVVGGQVTAVSLAPFTATVAFGAGATCNTVNDLRPYLNYDDPGTSTYQTGQAVVIYAPQGLDANCTNAVHGIEVTTGNSAIAYASLIRGGGARFVSRTKVHVRSNVTLTSGSGDTFLAIERPSQNRSFDEVTRRNWLDNAAFSIWQRGAGPFACNAAATRVFGPDRWSIISDGAGTRSLAQVAVTAAQAASYYQMQASYALRFTQSAGGAGSYVRIEQMLPFDLLNALVGRDMSLQFAIALMSGTWTSTTSMSLGFRQSFGSGGSADVLTETPFQVGSLSTGTYKPISGIFNQWPAINGKTIGAGAFASVYLSMPVAVAMDIAITELMLVDGAGKPIFKFPDIAEELRKAQRYYEQVQAVSINGSQFIGCQPKANTPGCTVSGGTPSGGTVGTITPNGALLTDTTSATRTLTFVASEP